jgi:nicotinate-nucleotide pyrophosphorylase (carboxylating)
MRRDDMERFLREDLGDGDVTSIALGITGACTFRVIAQEDCVLAGLEEAAHILRHAGLAVEELRKDGDRIRNGEVVLSGDGASAAALSSERLGLNMLMRMSGIATATATAVEECRRVNPGIRVAGTRKTTPGFRYYEKKAIRIGGGDPHRSRLDDAILIKDNHLSIIGSVTEAVRRSRAYSRYKVVEIEVTDIDMALEAARAGADIIMLDNFQPAEAAEAYALVKDADARIAVEVSGGITPSSAVRYAGAADVISIGALTHSVRSIHFTMDITAAGKS